MSGFSWFPMVEANTDIFLYYKHLLFIVVSIIMTIFLGFYIYKDKENIRLPYICIPLGIYAIFALTSSLFSSNYKFSISGMFDHFETVFVLLGYCIAVVYGIVCLKSIRDIDIIFKSLLISITIMNIIGISQLVGSDIITGNIGQQMIFPREMRANIGEFTMGFLKGTVYLTLFNPNYVGSYVGLLFPIISVILVLKRRSMEKLEVILYIINMIGLALCLYGSGSETGLTGIAVSLLIFVLMCWKDIFKEKYIKVIGILIVLSITLLGVYKRDTIIQKLTFEKSAPTLKAIETSKKVKIEYSQYTLYIDYIISDSGNMEIILVDGSDNNIETNINMENGVFEILDERFQTINITPVVYNNQFAIRIKIDEKNWDFVKNEDGDFYYHNIYGKLDKMIKADSMIFTGYEKYASGRGYIWSRSIPLLKDYIFLGSGADTFAIAFPQQDYVNLSNYGFEGQILTKPHNITLFILWKA